MSVRRLYLRDIAQVMIYAGSNIASIRPINGGASVDIVIQRCQNPIVSVPINVERREHQRRLI